MTADARTSLECILLVMPSPRRPADAFQASPALVRLMAAQAGVFSAEQAYRAGHTRDEIVWLRAAGVLVSVRRGVYAFREHYASLRHEEQHELDVTATLLKVKQPTTVSHESAAVLHGLPLLRPDLRVVHLTRPELKASRLEAGVHHHPGGLPAGHVTRVKGIATTTPARTAVDVARSTDFPRGLAAVDSALRSGATHESVREVLEHCASWPGARGASRAVAHGDGAAANPGESWSRAILLGHGLPPARLQYVVVDEDGLVGYVDFAWPELGVLGEFDGRLKYNGDPDLAASVVWDEKLREDRLRALGWEVVRWTWDDLLHPERLVARIRAAMARAAGRRIPGA